MLYRKIYGYICTSNDITLSRVHYYRINLFMIPLNRISRVRLENWCNLEYVFHYLDRYGALHKNISKEGFEFLALGYFRRLNKKIAYCERIEPKDEFIFYTLAQLYDRVDLDESQENLFKRKARFCAIRSIRKNKNYDRSWALLSDIYAWISLVETKNKSIHFVEKAITYIKKAIKYDPKRKEYQEKLKGYYHLRNQEYVS